jgi:hypothetical protein
MSKNKRLLIIAGLLAAGLALGAYRSVRIIKAGAQSYMLGYPLVLMDVCRVVMTDPHTGRTAATVFPMQCFPIIIFAKWCAPTMIHFTRQPGVSRRTPVLTGDTRGRCPCHALCRSWTNVFAMVGNGDRTDPATHAGRSRLEGKYRQ